MRCLFVSNVSIRYYKYLSQECFSCMLHISIHYIFIFIQFIYIFKFFFEISLLINTLFRSVLNHFQILKDLLSFSSWFLDCIELREQTLYDFIFFLSWCLFYVQAHGLFGKCSMGAWEEKCILLLLGEVSYTKRYTLKCYEYSPR